MLGVRDSVIRDGDGMAARSARERLRERGVLMRVPPFGVRKYWLRSVAVGVLHVITAPSVNRRGCGMLTESLDGALGAVIVRVVRVGDDVASVHGLAFP